MHCRRAPSVSPSPSPPLSPSRTRTLPLPRTPLFHTLTSTRGCRASNYEFTASVFGPEASISAKNILQQRDVLGALGVPYPPGASPTPSSGPGCPLGHGKDRGALVSCIQMLSSCAKTPPSRYLIVCEGGRGVHCRRLSDCAHRQVLTRPPGLLQLYSLRAGYKPHPKTSRQYR